MATFTRTSSTTHSLPPAPRSYWLAVGFLLLVFTVSAALYIDRQATIDTYDRLGFPGARLFWPVLVAKVAGVITVAVGRYRTLTLFAYAGFLYDLLLALQAHLAEGEPDVVLAIVGLVAWAVAFRADRQRFGPPR